MRKFQKLLFFYNSTIPTIPTIPEFFFLRTMSWDLLGGVEYTEEIQEMEEIAVEDVEDVRDSSHKDLPSLPLTVYHQL